MFRKDLSLTQSPPISVPFRFFLTAPIFGILLGLTFFFFPLDTILNRYSPIAVGTIHLFTLGILSMIIFGTMQQMLPILTGVIIEKPKLFAAIVHTSLTLGTLFFSASFIFEIRDLMYLGVSFLAIAFITFFGIATYLIFKIKFSNSTIKAMRLFVIAGIVTFGLGGSLVYGYISNDIEPWHYKIANLHVLFGLFGFATILIMGIAFKVIPMFYITLDFSKFVQNKTPLLMLIALFLFGVFLFFGVDTYYLKLIFASIFLLFCINALNSLNKRHSTIFDVTLWYWKLSLSFLLISTLNWLFVPQDSYFALAIMFGLGFLYSLLQGMIYKIIPFLAWFHLHNQGYMQVPTIKEMVSEDRIKLHFYIYVSSLLFFLLSSWFNMYFTIIAAFLFIASNVLFFINCLSGISKYKQIIKTKPVKITTQS